ncbi:MAG: MFS transporter [Dehalococcoidia bacterium]|nr:MFS transporter [Dehalococcoidia bacterium]
MTTLQVSPKGRRLHYAWVVLVSGMALASLQAMVRQSFGVFIDPLVDQFGWSRGDISLAYAISFVGAVAASLGLGSLTERIGARRIMLLGIAGISTGLMLTATVSTLWQLYLYYGLIFGGLGFLLNVVIPVAVTRWFGKGVGLALGLMWASVGIGGIMGPVAFRWFITNMGWRTTFFTAGLVIGAAMLLALLLFRSQPQDKGITAYGDDSETGQTKPVEAATAPSLPHLANFGLIRRTGVFWRLINIHLLGCLGHSVLLAHVVAIAIHKGVPGLVAAGILSTSAGTSTISRFIIPMLAEKLGGRRTLAIAFVLQASPIPFLLLASEVWHFYAIAFLFGLGYGAEMPAYPIINRQYWGSTAPLNSIYSWQLAGAMTGMAIGGYLGGVLFDISGTYTWSIMVAFVFTATGLVPILTLPHHHHGVILERAPRAVAPVTATIQDPD